MGSANNIGIRLAKTNYVLILNPDVKLIEDTIINLSSEIELIKNLAIASPLEITSLKKKKRETRITGFIMGSGKI